MSVFGLCERPIIVAPMAGGPTTPSLVAAAANAGAIGFLAAGYKSAAQVADEIAVVTAATTGAYGVNVFVPGVPTSDVAAVDRYLADLRPDADTVGVELGEGAWDDDDWTAKQDLLVDAAPPVASFTFGLPPTALVAALRHRGTIVMVTATTPSEAAHAATLGVDCLCLQGNEAGAHRGSFTNDPGAPPGPNSLDLLATVVANSDVPVVVAGGVALPEHVAAALAGGAIGVQAGTAFLRCDESGTHPLHQAALVDPAFTDTAVTRSFSGRPARGLVNDFMRSHPTAPAAYPEINNATRPLRAAAAQRGDVHRMSLWAGTGHRHTRRASASDILEWLAAESSPRA